MFSVLVKRNMYTLRLYAILHRNAEWPRPDTVTHTEWDILHPSVLRPDFVVTHNELKLF